MSNTKTLKYGNIPGVGMSDDINYNIILADNNGLITIGDVDLDTSTSLELFGKKSVKYGNGFWGNLVHLLENFNSTKEPRNPIKGQLWYDSYNDLLKVCTITTPVKNLVDFDTYNNSLSYISGAKWATINILPDDPSLLPKPIDEDYIKQLISTQNSEPNKLSHGGQIWYETDTNIARILIDNDGSTTKQWAAINSITFGTTAPTIFNKGQLWYDGKILKISNSNDGIDAKWEPITRSLTDDIPLIVAIEPSKPLTNQLYLNKNKLTLNLGTKNLEFSDDTSLVIKDANKSTDDGAIKFDKTNHNLIISNNGKEDIFYSNNSTIPSLNIPISKSLPNESTKTGDIWFNDTDGLLYVEQNKNTWVTFSNSSTLKLPFNSTNKDAGIIYYDKTDNKLMVSDGTTFKQPLNLGGITEISNTGANNQILQVSSTDSKKASWVTYSPSITETQITNLDWSSIVKNQKFIDAIKSMGLGGVSLPSDASGVSKLSPADIASLTSDQLKALETANIITGLTADQIKVLTNEQLSKLSNSSIDVMITKLTDADKISLLGKLSSSQLLGSIDLSSIGNIVLLTDTIIDKLSEASLLSLIKNQLENLTVPQITKLMSKVSTKNSILDKIKGSTVLSTDQKQAYGNTKATSTILGFKNSPKFIYGETLTPDYQISDIDGTVGASYSIEWFKDSTSVGLSNTYEIKNTDAVSIINYHVTFTDNKGFVETLKSLNTMKTLYASIVLDSTKVIAGANDYIENNTLSIDFKPSTIVPSYQWYRDNAIISGETKSSYTITNTDVGYLLYVSITLLDGRVFTISGYNVSAAPKTNNPKTSGDIIITGSQNAGQTLTASNNVVDDGTITNVTYDWYINGVNTLTATSRLLLPSDVGSNNYIIMNYTDGLNNTKQTLKSALFTISAASNSPPSGHLVIEAKNPCMVGDKLTYSSNFSDIDGINGNITYTWYLDGNTELSGIEYTTNKVGTVTLVAKYTDNLGNYEKFTANNSITVLSAAPKTNNPKTSGDIIITGSQNAGQTLTASNNVVDDGTITNVTYDWYINGVNTLTATSRLLLPSDVGSNNYIIMNYTDGLNNTKQTLKSAVFAISAASNSLPSGNLVIEAKTPCRVGDKLTYSSNFSDIDGINGNITYTWYLDGNTELSGSEYTANTAGIVTLSARYTDNLGNYEKFTANNSVTVLPAGATLTADKITTADSVANITLTGIISMSDNSVPDITQLQIFFNANSYTSMSPNKLTMDNGKWSVTIPTPPIGAYDIGAAYKSQTLTTLTNYVTITKFVTPQTPPTGQVIITGKPEFGQTLSASNTLADVNSINGSITYKWQGAYSSSTENTYKILEPDIGSTISLTASYTDGLGKIESITVSTAIVTRPQNSIPTGNALITEDPTLGIAVGATLTCSRGTVTDSDSSVYYTNTFTYQWLRDGIAIAGETNNAYIIKSADQGTTLSASFGFTDGLGNIESGILSNSIIIPPPDLSTGHVSILGTAKVGTILNAKYSMASDSRMMSIAYSWSSGATSQQCTITNNDIGNKMSVTITVTDINDNVLTFTKIMSTVVSA